MPGWKKVLYLIVCGNFQRNKNILEAHEMFVRDGSYGNPFMWNIFKWLHSNIKTDQTITGLCWDSICAPLLKTWTWQVSCCIVPERLTYIVKEKQDLVQTSSSINISRNGNVAPVWMYMSNVCNTSFDGTFSIMICYKIIAEMNSLWFPECCTKSYSRKML